MKKTVMLAVCIMLLGAQMVMAGGGSSQRGSSSGAVTITVWNNTAHSRLERDTLVEAFNRGEGVQRGIVIENRVFGGDYHPMLDIALAAGEEPHIFLVNQPKYPQVIEEGKILPLTEFPQWIQTDLIDKYRPYMMDAVHIFDGVVYQIPWGGTASSTMAYNIPLIRSIGLNEPPKTWAEFERACIEIARRNPDKYGTLVPLAYVNYHSAQFQPVFIRNYGRTWFDFTTGRYQFSEFAEFFEMLQRISAGGGMFPGIEPLTDDQGRAQFAEGNVAFLITSPSYNVGVLYDQFPAKIEWGVTPLILRDANVYYNHMGAAGGSYALGTKPKKENILEQAARAFYAIYNDEATAFFYTAGKDIPKIPEIAARARLSDRPQWNDTARINAGAVAVPTLPDQYFSVEGDDVRTAFSKILTGSNARQILVDMENRFNAAFDRAITRGTVRRETFIIPSFQQDLRNVAR